MLWRAGTFAQRWRWPGARAVLLVVLASLVLTSCGEVTPRLPALAPDAMVLAFGDSLTYGTGAKANQSYPAHLARLIGREVVREAVPGEISESGLQRLENVLEEHQPDLVVLCHGGNDILRNLDAEDTRENLLEMIEMVRASGASVVLVGVPAKGISLSTADFYLEVAEQANVPIEGDIVGDILGDSRLKSDAVHPNAAGYQAFAEAIAKLLERHGAL